MVDKKVVDFIRESRRRGFGDDAIAQKLSDAGWSINEIDAAFNAVKNTTPKVRLCANIDEDVAKMLARRAKRNMMSIEEQVEDILRRSCVSMRKKTPGEEKMVGNGFISIFSRRRYSKEKK